MDLAPLIESLGESTVIALAGLLIGALFGAFAQRSRFCLRSAVIEFWNRDGTAKLAVWLFAFSAAIIATQLFITLGWLDVAQARQLSAKGSLSGAIAGGADTFLSKGKAKTLDAKLAKATKWVGLAFVVLTLALHFV